MPHSPLRVIQPTVEGCVTVSGLDYSEQSVGSSNVFDLWCKHMRSFCVKLGVHRPCTKSMHTQLNNFINIFLFEIRDKNGSCISIVWFFIISLKDTKQFSGKIFLWKHIHSMLCQNFWKKKQCRVYHKIWTIVSHTFSLYRQDYKWG